MPIGVNVNNPQEQVSTPTTSLGNTVSFGGNAVGSGASTATSSGESVSTILIYGVIALVVIYVLKKLEG
jgi:hypothetical protein